MLKQWEVFKVGPTDQSTYMHVTLGLSGEILIGAVAYRKLGKPEAAVLMFDKANSLIGVVPSNRHTKHAYPLKPKMRCPSNDQIKQILPAPSH